MPVEHKLTTDERRKEKNDMTTTNNSRNDDYTHNWPHIMKEKLSNGVLPSAHVCWGEITDVMHHYFRYDDSDKERQ